MKRITTFAFSLLAAACFVLFCSQYTKADEKVTAESSKQATDENAKKDSDKQSEKQDAKKDDAKDGIKEEKKSDSADAKTAKTPADRIVVMYFHRTQRCPTCRRMGTYTEESVKEKYAEHMKKGTVEFHFIDFQDKKNETLTKGYKVSGPTLIVAKVEDNKVKDFKNLTEIWAKNNDKQAFYKYVQENVSAYEKKPDTEKK